MESKKIIVPVDFTPASDQAILQAISIAQKSMCSIRLLHLLENNTQGDIDETPLAIEDKLNVLAKSIASHGIDSDFILKEGSIFDEIPLIANSRENFILVIGTHGVKGLRQKLFGADILKLVRKISIPCLIVQEQCQNHHFSPIVFPVGGHKNFDILIKSTADLAKLYKAEVHIYSVALKGEAISDEIKENIALAEKIFTENSISFKRVIDDLRVISIGFACQTAEYAKETGAGLISIMSVKSEEHYYLAQADKETLINNLSAIPVLCHSGLKNI